LRGEGAAVPGNQDWVRALSPVHTNLPSKGGAIWLPNRKTGVLYGQNRCYIVPSVLLRAPGCATHPLPSLSLPLWSATASCAANPHRRVSEEPHDRSHSHGTARWSCRLRDTGASLEIRAFAAALLLIVPATSRLSYPRCPETPPPRATEGNGKTNILAKAKVTKRRMIDLRLSVMCNGPNRK